MESNKKTNWFKRQMNGFKRFFFRLSISTKLDKNKMELDHTKLSKEVSNSIAIFKKVLSNESTHIGYNRRDKDKEYTISDGVSKIHLTNHSVSLNTLKIMHNEIVLSVTIPNDVFVYLHWLIDRRINVNFTKIHNEINIANDNQIILLKNKITE